MRMSSGRVDWTPTEGPPRETGSKKPSGTFLGRLWSRKRSDRKSTALAQQVSAAFTEPPAQTRPPLVLSDEHARDIVEQATAYLDGKKSPFPRTTVTIGKRTFEVEQCRNRLRISGFGESETVSGDIVEKNNEQPSWTGRLRLRNDGPFDPHFSQRWQTLRSICSRIPGKPTRNQQIEKKETRS